MNTRLRRDTDDEIYIYINEENEVLNWNWKNNNFEEKYVVYVEELQYCCIAFCATIFILFML